MKKPEKSNDQARRARRKAGEVPGKKRGRNLTVHELNEALRKGSTPEANEALKSRLDGMVVIID